MWQPENKEEFLKARDRGLRNDKIAELFNTTLSKVKHYLNYLKYNEVDVIKPLSSHVSENMWKADNKEEFIRYYNKGYTDIQLAEEFSTTIGKVKKYLEYLRKQGDIVARKEIVKEKTIDLEKLKNEFIKFLSKAKSLAEINNKFGENAEELLGEKYTGLNIFNLIDDYGKPAIILLPAVDKDKIKVKDRKWEYFQSKSEFGDFVQPYLLVQLKDELFDNEENCVHIVPIYDAHFGSCSHKTQKFKDYINWIESKPNVLTFFGGDIVENALDDGRGMAYEQQLNPEQQILEIIEMLASIADRCLFALPGNHEWRSYKKAGIDPTMFIAKTLGIPYFQGPCYCSLLGKGQKWKLYASHGKTAAITKGGLINAAARPQKFVDFIPFLISGHAHNALIVPDTVISENLSNPGLDYKTQYIIVCSSFLAWEGSYAYRAEYAPPTNGSAVLTLCADGSYSAYLYDKQHQRKSL